MPYQSAAQRGYLHAHPEITDKKGHSVAAKWDAEIRAKKKKSRIKKVAYVDVVKSADPNFNHHAARTIFEAVMKMDEESARMYTHILVSDVLEELIEKNLPELQEHLNEVLADRFSRISKATVAALKENQNEQGLAFAESLAMISKATNPYDRGYRFKESDFSRDPGSGRFRAKVKTTQKKPIHDKTADSLGLPTSADKKTSKGPNLNDKDLARYQDQYRQLSNFLSAVRASGQAGDFDVIAHVQDRTKPPYDPDSVYTQTITSTKEQKGLWNPKTEDLVGLDARPRNLTAGGAAFGLYGALGGDSTSQRGQGLARTTNALDTRMGPFAADWTKDYGTQNQNAKLYGRLQTGGALLSDLGAEGGKVQTAGRLAQFVGDHGPDAEAVFGPTARKTAYRYRGVTRTPDTELVNSHDNAVRSSQRLTEFDPAQRSKMRAEQTRAINARRVQLAEEHNKKEPDYRKHIDIQGVKLDTAERSKIMTSIADKYRQAPRTPSEDDLQAGREGVISWLNEKGRRPRKGLYNLQLASGNTPPSEGVLLDSKGKVVAQAVGYGDDHYLPFNLKQLGKLNGGEYVRRRSVGGLTSEDIYTGLMTGAKRVTVVSRSGTFTMEFQDDIKGRKRNFNDKARRMTRRYEQLLDAIQSKQVDAKNVSPQIRAAITQEVKTDLGGYGLPASELNRAVERRIQEFKQSPELAENEERLATTMMAMDPARMSRDEAAFRDEMLNVIAAEKEYKFRLNGHGYSAALTALEEQFPYYIRAESTPLREGHDIETEVDRGYVEPGKNRPTYAAAGLFGAATASPFAGTGGKISAAEANYQSGRGPVSPKTPEEKTAEGEVKPAQEVKQKIAQARSTESYVTAARQLQAKLKAMHQADEITDLSDSDLKALNYTAEEFRNPDAQGKFDALVTAVANTKKGRDLGDTLPKYRAAAGHIGRQKFAKDLVGVWTDKPLIFDHPAYQAGASPGQIKLERDALEHEARGAVSTDKALSSLDDHELETEHTMLREMKTYFDAAGADSPEARVDALKGIGVHHPATGALSRLAQNPVLLDRQLEIVHRMRALHEQVPAADRGVDEAEIVAPAAEPAAIQPPLDQGYAVDRMIRVANDAQQFWAERGDDVRADDVNIMRQVLEANRGAIDSQDTWNSWLTDNQDVIKATILDPEFQEWRRSRKRPGGTNILG